MKIIKKTLLTLFILISCYTILLFYPQALFKKAYQYKNFTVYSNQEISKEIEKVLSEAQNITACNRHDSRVKKYQIFLCNSQWRFTLFTWNYWFTMLMNDFSSNLFIPKSDIKQDKLSMLSNSLYRLKNDTLSQHIAQLMYNLRFRKLYGKF